MTSALIAVASDATLRTRLKDALSRRFGADFRINACDSPTSGLDQLREPRHVGGQVVLVMAPLRAEPGTAVDFFVEARGVDPAAKRIAIIDVGDAALAGDSARR